MKIIGKMKSEEVDVKRFYLPGVKLTGACPKCAKKCVSDFENEYLSYPTAEKAFDFDCCCKCGHEWKVKLVLRIALTLATVS